MRGQWRAGRGFCFPRRVGNTCAELRGERSELRGAGTGGDVRGSRCWVLKKLPTFDLFGNVEHFRGKRNPQVCDVG